MPLTLDAKLERLWDEYDRLCAGLRIATDPDERRRLHDRLDGICEAAARLQLAQPQRAPELRRIIR